MEAALTGISGGTPGYLHRLGEASAGRYESNPETERPAIGPRPANNGPTGSQTPGSSPSRRSCCHPCTSSRRPAVPRRPLGAVFDRRGWQWLPTHQAERASGGAAGGARFTAGPNPRCRAFQGVPQGTGTGLESPPRAAVSRTRRPNDLQSAQGRQITARQGASARIRAAAQLMLPPLHERPRTRLATGSPAPSGAAAGCRIPR